MKVIIISAFGRLHELSWHPYAGPASQVVSKCSPSSLFRPLDHGVKCFLGCLSVSFPLDSRSGLDVWYRSLGFRRACPIRLQLFWRISSSAGCCFFCFQSSLLLIVSDLRMQRILLRQVLMNVWIFFSVAAAVFHASALYSRTGSTVALNILILIVQVRWGQNVHLKEVRHCFTP